MIADIIMGFVLIALAKVFGGYEEAYRKFAILLTGSAAVIAIPIGVLLYTGDVKRRKFGGIFRKETVKGLTVGKTLLMFLMGTGLAIIGNMLVLLIGNLVNLSEYVESMGNITENQPFLLLIFCVGILGPLAEEILFRWLVYLRMRDLSKSIWIPILVSSLLFGIYHGNLSQMVYATVLGSVFAYSLEATGSLLAPVFLHMGANCLSTTWSYLPADIESMLLCLLSSFIIGVLAMILGFGFLRKRYAKRHDVLTEGSIEGTNPR
ncbi:MAG: CPBP family intramembrane metalloprotease [Blautia sp.]|nr:CPBP family intramembrane metalloprotease [Blautia sp.]